MTPITAVSNTSDTPTISFLGSLAQGRKPKKSSRHYETSYGMNSSWNSQKRKRLSRMREAKLQGFWAMRSQSDRKIGSGANPLMDLTAEVSTERLDYRYQRT